MKTTTVLLTLVLSFNSVVLAQKIHKDSLIQHWGKIENLADTINTKVPEFSFYAALVWNGKIIRKIKTGFADKKQKLLIDDKTIHLWGSVSKMFTSIAVIQLLTKGKISLDDPITKYIPELKQASDKYGSFDSVKVHHLLNHHSGLNARPCYDSLSANGIKDIPTTQQMSIYLRHAQLWEKPGTKYRYSNTGYSLLGMMIERITGQPLGKYIKKSIFQPLGMKTAHYGKSPKKYAKLIGKGYYKRKDGTWDIRYFDDDQGFQNGNGGVKATVQDMLKFIDFLKFRKRKKYIKKYQKVLTNRMLDAYYFKVNFESPQERYAIMVNKKVYKRLRIAGVDHKLSKKYNYWYFGHGGNIENYRSYYYFDKNNPYGVIMIYNTSGFRGSDEHTAERKLRGAFNYLLSTGTVHPQIVKWPSRTKK